MNPPDPFKMIFVDQKCHKNVSVCVVEFPVSMSLPLVSISYHVNEVNESLSSLMCVCVCVLQVPGEVRGENGESSEKEQQRSDTRRHRHALCSYVCKYHLHSPEQKVHRPSNTHFRCLRHDTTENVTVVGNAQFPFTTFSIAIVCILPADAR